MDRNPLAWGLLCGCLFFVADALAQTLILRRGMDWDVVAEKSGVVAIGSAFYALWRRYRAGRRA